MILDIDAFFAGGFPVTLSDSTTLSEGSNKQLNSEALSNFFDTPMVIDEIRVQLTSPNLGQETGDSIQTGNFGGSVRLSLSLGGRYALTSTYIPVGCFGPTYDGGTVDSAVYRAGSLSVESLASVFDIPYHVGYYRWKLPRPLVIPVGMPLEAKISRQIEGFSQVFVGDDNTLSVNVAYMGRVAKKRLPKGLVVPIPYVGLFENVFTSASVATSGQLDLYNPFKSTLNVQRLIGRWQNIYLDTLTPDTSAITLDVAGNSSLGNTAIDFPLVQIKTFDGFYITNGFIPGATVWEANTRALNLNVAFEPGQGLEVTIDATAGVPATEGEDSTVDGSNTSFVTMIGWRNENL